MRRPGRRKEIEKGVVSGRLTQRTTYRKHIAVGPSRSLRKPETVVDKVVVKTGVPELGVPLNMAVRYGQMLFVSGIPPFSEEFAARLRAARAKGEPLPAFPDIPFEQQATMVMDYLKDILEAAGSTMDHLIKVNVWLKEQKDQPTFDKVYRTYFKSQDTMPARTRLQAGGTPLGCGLEVEAIGYVPEP
jgi:2-iminobutanoate/2-iminopropanoate deaminase